MSKIILGFATTNKKNLFIRIYVEKNIFDFYVNIKFVFRFILEKMCKEFINRNESSKKFSGSKKKLTHIKIKFVNEINLNLWPDMMN